MALKQTVVRTGIYGRAVVSSDATTPAGKERDWKIMLNAAVKAATAAHDPAFVLASIRRQLRALLKDRMVKVIEFGPGGVKTSLRPAAVLVTEPGCAPVNTEAPSGGHPEIIRDVLQAAGTLRAVEQALNDRDTGRALCLGIQLGRTLERAGVRDVEHLVPVGRKKGVDDRRRVDSAREAKRAAAAHQRARIVAYWESLPRTREAARQFWLSRGRCSDAVNEYLELAAAETHGVSTRTVRAAVKFAKNRMATS